MENISDRNIKFSDKKIDGMALIWSIIAVLPVYLYRLFNAAIGVDTEIAIADLKIEKNWLLGCGRFSRYIIKSILGFLAKNYYTATIASIVTMIVVDYIILVNIKKYIDKNLSGLCILMLFSNPIFAEINYFTGDAFNYFLGIIAAMVSVYLASHAILVDYHNRKKYIFAVLTGAIGLGFYQAYYYLLMAFVIMVLIVYLDYKQDYKSIACILGKFVLYGVLVLACYYILQKIFYTFFYHSSWDYVGYENPDEYIRSTILWNVMPVKDCITRIKSVIESDLNILGIFNMILLYILLIMLIIYYIYEYAIHKNKIAAIKIVLFGLLYGTYFLQIFISGGNIAARQKALPTIIICFLFMYVLQIFDRRKGRICKGVVCIIIVIISIGQMLVSIELFKTDTIRYNQDRDRAFEIQNELEQQIGVINDKKIIFLGSWGNNLRETQLCGELIGDSIWTWDSYTDWGINYRVYYFMLVNGIQYEKPTKEDIKRGIVWLSENSIEGLNSYIFIQDPQTENIIYCILE